MCFPGEVQEHHLCHVLRQMGFSHDSHGAGIDEIEMPIYQLGERALGAVFGIFTKQFKIVHTHASTLSLPQGGINRTRI